MALTVGAHLGPYEIIAPLGAGGMGEVYKARDTRLNRVVAIKVLPTETRHTGALERLRREAEVVSRLSHPNICALYDIGEHDGITFLVMEHLEGETLADRLAAGPLPLEQALRQAVHIASALDEAHRQGVVHRDLKPANIILTRSGVKVLDFGLAKVRDQAPEDPAGATRSFGLTAEGILLGTVPYMSPEQLEGRAVDARADIFAFGATLYEMITGTRPFRGTSRASLVAAILTTEPEPLQAWQPMTPPLLDRVVRRCLAKDPDDRWQTARDLGADLAFLAEGGSHVELRGPKARRWRRGWLIAAALLGATLAAGAMAVIVARRPEASAPLFRRLTFRSGFITSARFAPDGESIVYGAAWDGRLTELFLGRLGSTEARPLGLSRTRVLSISPSGEMALLLGGPFNMFQGTLARVPLAGGAPRELLQDVKDADWIGDTGQLAVLRKDGHKFALDLPIGNRIYESQTMLWYMRVSPRGDRVAFCEGSVIGQGDVVAVDRLGKRTTLSRGWVGLFGLAWSPSGDEVWFTATRPSVEEGPPAVRAVSLSGKERLVTRAPTWLFVNEVFRDGRVLLGSNVARAGVRCRGPGQSVEREMGWLDSSHVQGLSADGETLLFGEGAGSGATVHGVFVQGVAAGAPNGAAYLRRTDGSASVHLGDGYPASLSPDGKRVLVAGTNNKEWTVLPTGPGMPKQLTLGKITRTYVGQWLDDRRIVFSGYETGRPMRAFVQDVEDGTPRPVTPEGVSPSMLALAVPGGEHVLALAGTRWQLYPVSGGSPRPLPFQVTGMPIAWSGDGRSMYVTDPGDGDYMSTVNVYRQDVATGRRQLWKALSLPDAAGIESIGPLVVAADGNSYCYTYTRTLGTLYVVEGLR